MKKIENLIARGYTLRQIKRGNFPRKELRDVELCRELVLLHILMVLVVQRQPTVSLCFPDAWGDRVRLNYLMYNGIKDNVSGFFTVTPTDPTLVVWKSAIDAFKAAQDKVDAEDHDAVATRDIKWKAVMRLNKKIQFYVQNIVDDNLDSAVLICEDAHMVLTLRGGSKKNEFDAWSERTGEIQTSGVVRYPRQCIEWEICTNPTEAASWNEMRLPPTLAAFTEIKGLISGKDYYVRCRIISKDGPEDWSETKKVRVK